MSKPNPKTDIRNLTKAHRLAILACDEAGMLRLFNGRYIGLIGAASISASTAHSLRRRGIAVATRGDREGKRLYLTRVGADIANALRERIKAAVGGRA